MSGSMLKVIAMAAMLTDHIGAFMVDRAANPWLYYIIRGAGRIAFPIFCFLIVEGYFHTRDIRRYILRLAVFGLISEIPFDLARKGRIDISFNHQNVLFTLLIGLVTVWAVDTIRLRCETWQAWSLWMQCAVVFCGCILAYLLKTDYQFYGIIQIMVFYYFRGERYILTIYIALLNVFSEYFTGAFSIIFINKYNGRRGFDCKYLMYMFYPFHLLAIYAVQYVLG